MTDDEFAVLHAKYRSVITALARKLVGSDDALVGELEAEGMIILWQLDYSKVTKNEDAWIRQSLKYKMIDYLRRRRSWRSESLDAMLEAQNQIVQTSAGEYVVLPSEKQRNKRRMYTERESGWAGRVREEFESE